MREWLERVIAAIINKELITLMLMMQRTLRDCIL